MYVPYCKPRFGSELRELLKEYPPSLQKRIQLVDTDEAGHNRVSAYLKPVYDEVVGSPSTMPYEAIRDFMYKLILASRYHAEADVSMSPLIPYHIQTLRGQLQNEEAKFRLDQVQGIYSIYLHPERIETFVVYPGASTPSIYERISDFLDEAAVLELSKSRYMLGIPSKARMAMIEIGKRARHLKTEHDKQKWIRVVSELIQVAGRNYGVNFPKIDALETSFSTYNPPLVDLDYYRVQACKTASPGSFPNFILPDGITRALGDEYFRVRENITWNTA